MTVPTRRAEQARAVMIELFPDGFEELETVDELQLIAYTDSGGEERLWQAFGGAASTEIEDGWEDRWRDFHRPVRVADLWVGPPWAEPEAGTVAIVIDPGRAFGTGGHATTRLCLGFLRDLEPGSLLDVGSGSGVLAIAAARLGFAPVAAVDHDPAAVEATARNAERNGVDVDVRLIDASAPDATLPPARYAVANISLDAVTTTGPVLACERLIASGYLASEEPVVPGFARLERRSAEGWAADLFERETQ